MTHVLDKREVADKTFGPEGWTPERLSSQKGWQPDDEGYVQAHVYVAVGPVGRQGGLPRGDVHVIDGKLIEKPVLREMYRVLSIYDRLSDND